MSEYMSELERLRRLYGANLSDPGGMVRSEDGFLENPPNAYERIGETLNDVGDFSYEMTGIPLAERGIEVVAAVGANAAAVAEQALALLLACAKSVPQLNERMHAGHWDKATHKSVELGGRTIGLVGLGAIGLRLAKMADALDMRVLGFDPFAKNLPDFVQAADLETIWRESDAISLHCPLTDDNRDLLDADTLARCKKGVIVVNTARGGLIDEAALLAAVHSGQVRMAGLDSFAVEPMAAGHPFQHQSGFILSPHIGGVTSDAYVNMGLGAARNALAVLNRTATA